MIGDPTRLRELCASFAGGLPGADATIAARGVDEVETELGVHVSNLARALGWRTGLSFRLAPIDFPRVGAFPKRNHEQGAWMRLRGEHGAELWMNAHALDNNFCGLLARLPVLLWLFGSALEREPQIVADVACYPGDVCSWDAVNFSGTVPRSCFVPDPSYFETAGFDGFRAAIGDPPEWEDRRRGVIWRGSTTGIKRYWPPSMPDDVRWLPRLELCEQARSPALADTCDVGFTALVQIPDDLRTAMEHALAPLRRPWVPHTDWARFRAAIDIDGNSSTWARGLICSFLTGTCVIKIDSEHGFRQWFYDRIEPWVHYVPVKSDLSDLASKVGMVLEDETLARSIGEAGRRFALSLDFITEMSSAVDRLVAWIAKPGAGVAPALLPPPDPFCYSRTEA